ncbi:MAG: TonB family protein [Myxococcota bacterium]
MLLVAPWLWAAAAEPSLPALRTSVPPAYPAQALEAGVGAVVLLEIDVDAAGAVVGVRVIESGGPAFDAAAVQAARSYTFTPATDADGQPVPMTVQYRSVFEPTRAAPVSVVGRVRAAGTREPLGDLDVTLTRGDRVVVAESDDDGRFRVAGLDDGLWTVRVASPGYRDEVTEIEVAAGRVTEVALYPVEDRPWEVREDGVSADVLVVGRRVAPEITERVLSAEEARYLPGTNGDVIRVVQNLPGVARPPLNIGQLLIRGTAPEDSAYYLDGAQIPLVFHFAGFSTVLNGDAIAEIAYLPGNYGVRYGRTLGGIVDLRVDDALPERSRGYVSVDLFQTTAFAEQKLGERTALTLSGRRSYIDAVLTPLLSSLGDATVQAPRYYDLQLRLLGRTRRGGTLDTLLLLSDDRFRVVGRDADDVEQVQIGLTTTFQKIRLLSREPLGGGWLAEASAIVGPERQAFDLAPDGEAYEAPFTVAMREEFYRAPPPERGLGLRAGVDAQVGLYRFRYAIPGFGDPEAGNVARLAPAVYVEPTLRLGAAGARAGPALDAALQLGLDYGALALDPRLSGRLDLGETGLKASYGGYSQWPTVRQALERPALGLQRGRGRRAWGWSGRSVRTRRRRADGLRQPPDGPRLRPRGRLPLLQRPAAHRPPRHRPLRQRRHREDHRPRGAGEAPDRAHDGLARDAFGRSTRIDRPGEEVALFEYDQPLILTALGVSHQLPRRWRLGARGMAWATPTLRWSTAVPTSTGARSARCTARSTAPGCRRSGSSTCASTRTGCSAPGPHAAYLDVQNATNAANVEVMSWTFDYEEDPITQIPLVPVFGVRGSGEARAAAGAAGRVRRGPERRDGHRRAARRRGGGRAAGRRSARRTRDGGGGRSAGRGRRICLSGAACPRWAAPRRCRRSPRETVVPWVAVGLLPVWFLACAPGLCGDLAAVDEATLQDPASWLQGLPLSGVSAAVRTTRIGEGENPVIAEAPEGPLVAAADAEVPLGFTVPGAATAYGLATAGGFARPQQDVASDGAVTLPWVGGAAPGRVYVVFEDGEGGTAVWTADAGPP